MSDAPFSWTEQNVERLRALVENGLSAADIADVLNCGRNAVIGKVHRMKLQLALPAGGDGIAAAAAARAKNGMPSRAIIRRQAAPMVAPAPKIEAPLVDPTPKRWPKPAGPEAVDSDGLKVGLCHMPLWSDAERGGLFCGKPVAKEGSSWCSACRQLVYEPRAPRQQEDAQARAARQVRQASRSGAFA